MLFLQDMPRLIQMLGEELSVLEVGSQVGGFLYASTCYGWKPIGVDIGKDMCAFAKSKGHNVIEGTIESACFPDETFDAIFVWNCFEMLPDPTGTLKEIFRILRPGGKLFITIPNGDFIKVIERLLRFKSFDRLSENILKSLSYSILSGFPFQFGYTSKSITKLLNNGEYKNININNVNYLPVSSKRQLQTYALLEKNKLINTIYGLSQLIYKISLHKLILGPWMEIICEKSR